MCFLQPIRDCQLHFALGKEYRKEAIRVTEPHDETLPPIFGDMSKTHLAYGGTLLIRISIAAAAFFSLVNASAVSTALVLTAGAIVSLPTALIATGALAMYYGSIAVITALASGTFATIATGLLCLATGALCLRFYMEERVGLIEKILPNDPLVPNIGKAMPNQVT